MEYWPGSFFFFVCLFFVVVVVFFGTFVDLNFVSVDNENAKKTYWSISSHLNNA